MLFASAGSRRELSLDRLSTGDRRHLRKAINLLVDPGHASWLVLDPGDRRFGQRVHEAVLESLN